MKSSLKKAQKRYQANTKKTYLICLNKKKDKKIIVYIDKLDNKSEYFRKKVLEDMEIHNVKLDEEELKYLKVAVSNDAIVVSRQINLAKKENNEKAYNYWKKEKEFFHNLYEKLDFPVPEG